MSRSGRGMTQILSSDHYDSLQNKVKCRKVQTKLKDRRCLKKCNYHDPIKCSESLLSQFFKTVASFLITSLCRLQGRVKLLEKPCPKKLQAVSFTISSVHSCYLTHVAHNKRLCQTQLTNWKYSVWFGLVWVRAVFWVRQAGGLIRNYVKFRPNQVIRQKRSVSHSFEYGLSVSAAAF